MEPCVDTCIGADGLGDCTTTPGFSVAGDFACYRHLVAVVRQRATEVSTTGVVQVEVLR